MATEFRIYPVKNCHECPACDSGLTKGFGYAMDYFCKLSPEKDNKWGFKLVDSYIEWDSEKRKNGNFPKWCPLSELL